MTNYVVTGGAGFIGSHLTRFLIKNGHSVHVIDNLSSGKKENIDSKAHFYKKDITSLEQLDEVFKEVGTIDGIVHCAAKVSVQESIDNPSLAHLHNVDGTFNVLETARLYKASRVVFCTSAALYGMKKPPHKEDMSVDCLSPYALHKYIGEQMCLLYSKLYNVETVSLRYFNVYGSGMNPNGDYAAVIPKYLEMRKSGDRITIFGDGTQTRDFIHVDDIVRAIFLSLISEHVGNGEVINIGSGKSVSILELARLIGGEVEHKAAREEVKNSCADTTKAKELLSFSTKINFSEGITKLKNEMGIS